MKTETVFKYFNEPYQLHEEVWIMRPRFTNLEVVISCSYKTCFEIAEKHIKSIFKYVKP
jgi:hypothetical protein